MARILDTYTGHVCTDCVLIDANGTSEDEGSDLAYAVGMGQFPAGHPVLRVDSEEPHFHHDSSCIICGSRMGGDRFDATVTLFDH